MHLGIVAEEGAVPVLRGNQTIFALNETTTQWTAIRARMVPWAETAGFWTLVAFVVGIFALLPLGGGAPIGLFVAAGRSSRSESGCNRGRIGVLRKRPSQVDGTAICRQREVEKLVPFDQRKTRYARGKICCQPHAWPR